MPCIGLIVEANAAVPHALGKDAGPKLGCEGCARAGTEREAILPRLRYLLERLKAHLFIAMEVKAFNKKSSFSEATEIVVDLCRSFSRWTRVRGCRSERVRLF